MCCWYSNTLTLSKLIIPCDCASMYVHIHVFNACYAKYRGYTGFSYEFNVCTWLMVLLYTEDNQYCDDVFEWACPLCVHASVCVCLCVYMYCHVMHRCYITTYRHDVNFQFFFVQNTLCILNILTSFLKDKIQV